MHTTVAATTGPQVEVLVTEALITAVVPRWRSVLGEAAASRPGHLVVDLTGCAMLDAAGVEMLVDLHRRMRAEGGRLILRGVSARLYRLLQIARVDRVLQTASAPPGYQPRHRATRHTHDAASPVGTGAGASDGEIRWWEAVPSG